ncbi:Uncharacterized protein TCM_003531 [Theobroma cacao]|uniref:Uncharacterized protein n=1 Tax=Theobroma cacao TaxID=3641 RepID=A0A061DQ36_THECC|nr:Uncharacterized protein TCM_003531 [Theobroma cacao]
MPLERQELLQAHLFVKPGYEQVCNVINLVFQAEIFSFLFGVPHHVNDGPTLSFGLQLQFLLIKQTVGQIRVLILILVLLSIIISCRINVWNYGFALVVFATFLVAKESVNVVRDSSKQNRLLALHQSEHDKPGLGCTHFALHCQGFGSGNGTHPHRRHDLFQENRCLVLHC